MMDPVTAFAVAGNILQFIDAGAKLAGLAWSIYHSEPTSSSTHDHLTELTRITQSLDDVLGLLDLRLRFENDEPRQDSDLTDLAGECRDVAAQLLALLQKLGFPNHPPSRKRDALKVALLATWNKNEIDSLRSRLDSFRAQFNIQLLVSLRQYATQNLSKQEETLRELRISSANTSRVEGTVNSILEFLASKASFSDGETVQATLRNALITEIYQRVDQPTNSPALTPDAKKWIEQVALSTLKYDGMEDREGRISETYAKTFEWVFGADDVEHQTRPNLRSWLENEDQIYWITGKPGSGKSTLMKYICEQPTPRCMPYLTKWAGSRELVIASFYFWNSDTQIQMSRAGLLRSLLYQILAKMPRLIPIVLPSRWEALSIFGLHRQSQIWKEGDQSALEAAVRLATASAGLCLFIDGLDEFEGTPEVLVALVKSLTHQSTSLKVCVASRPWVTFETAFETQPHLRLEDLTYNDIKYFVTSKFEMDLEFAKLRMREPEFADELIENIVSKASGVFLWVHLVVASLLSGLSFGDRIVDLQKRLELLPPELEELYDKMLRSLEPFYLQHATQLLMIVEASAQRLPLLTLSFADEETVASVIKMPIAQKTDFVAIDLRGEAMRRRLNSRLKGLLQVDRPRTVDTASKTPRVYVHYLHRTVRDFVRQPRVQEFLQSSLEAPFDPHFSLCIGHYAFIKNFMKHGDPQVHLKYSLEYATQTIQASKDGMMEVVDDMANTLPGTSALSVNFLSLAVKEGLTAYVEARAEGPCLVRNPVAEGMHWPLLMDACRAQKLKLAMIELLLKLGADPNYRVEDHTPWEMVLQRLRPAHNRRVISSMLSLSEEHRSIVEVIVAFGADVTGAQGRYVESFRNKYGTREVVSESMFADSFFKELQTIPRRPRRAKKQLRRWLSIIGRK